MKILANPLLTLLATPVLSRAWGKIVRTKGPKFAVQAVIAWYKKHYGIDMSEYIGSPEDYASLSDFFTRPLDPATRPLKKNAASWLSPCDGVVSAIEKISSDSATLVKGRTYSVSELVGDMLDFSKEYYVYTIYLSPMNYHRFHIPVDSYIEASRHEAGRLYPVNKLGVNYIERLFLQNERKILRMLVDKSPYYYVAVGATFVGAIKMECTEPETTGVWQKVAMKTEQLDEIGRFEMGSTIVLVLPADKAGPPDITPGTVIRCGEKLCPRL